MKATIKYGILITVLIMNLANNELYSQSLKKTFKYIESNDIEKANLELNQFTDKDKTLPEDNKLFNLASCLIVCNENSQNYDPYKGLEIFEMASNIKANLTVVDEFLAKYGLSTNKVKETICLSILNQAKKLDTEASYKKALEVGYNCGFKPEVDTLWTNAAYKEAKSENTYEAYVRFFTYHGNSRYTLEVFKKFNEFEFQKAKVDISLESMNDYINNHTEKENPYLNEAIHLRDSIAFSSLNKTYSDYLNFSEKYPTSEYSDVIKQELPELLYNQALAGNNNDLKELFVNDYPNDKRADNLSKQLEQQYYEKLCSSASLLLFDNFRKKFPNSKHIEQFKEIYSLIELNDSLYNKTITGEKAGKELNSTFLISVIKNEIFKDDNFYLLLPYYHFNFFPSTLNFEILQLNGTVKSIKREHYIVLRGESSLKDSDEMTFDKLGVINSYRQSKWGTYNFEVVYHSENPIKFDSIVSSDYNSDSFKLVSKKYVFKYDKNDNLESIILYSTSIGSEDYRKEGQYYFLNFEKGVIVCFKTFLGPTSELCSNFYSFSESIYSVPIAYYKQGNLEEERTFDNLGKQYLISNRNHTYTNDTIIFDTNNKLLQFHGGRKYYTGYFMDNNFKNEYTEEDYKGNWTILTTQTLSKIEYRVTKREINYY